MIRLPINQIGPGMVVAVPIVHPCQANKHLLQAGYPLDENVIGQLARFGVGAVWVKHPGFDFLEQRLDRAILRRRARLYETVRQSFEGIANRIPGAFDLLAYRQVICELVLDLMANARHAVWAERLMKDDYELFTHSANVAYLSLVIGMQLRTYVAQERRYARGADAENLTNLGVGAILHDVGKLGLDKGWHRVHCMDAESDSEEYRSHTERGFGAIRERIDATAANAVLDHHQRFDGSGFPVRARKATTDEPEPLAGHDIHIFSRIVSVANVLDGYLRPDSGDGRTPVEALWSLRELGKKGWFDPVVLQAALRAIPPFPPGDSVELSDGRKAVVTDLTNAPCRPIVRLVESGGQSTDEEIDLATSGTPSITKALDKPVAAFLY